MLFCCSAVVRSWHKASEAKALNLRQLLGDQGMHGRMASVSFDADDPTLPKRRKILHCAPPFRSPVQAPLNGPTECGSFADRWFGRKGL